MSNHHAFLFVGLPLALRSLWIVRRNLGGGGIAASVGFVVLGLVPYAYLPYASASAAAVSWGDETTWNGFWEHVLRKTYGTFSMGQSSATGVGGFIEKGTMLPSLWSLVGHAFPRLTVVGLPLAAFGFYACGRRHGSRDITLVLASALAFYVLGFSALSNLAPNAELYLVILGRFCIQSDLMLSIAAGLGFAKLLPSLEQRWQALRNRPSLAYGFPALVLVAGIAAHGGGANQRNNHVLEDFVRTAFASLPQNAIVMSFGDHVSGAVSYFHGVEKVRPDVVHLDRELLTLPWYQQRKRRLHPDLYLPPGGYSRNGWSIKQLLDGNSKRPFVVIDHLDTWDQSWRQDYHLSSQGIVHLLVPKSQSPTFEEWSAQDLRAMGDYDVLPALRSPEASWENAVGRLVLTTQGLRAHIAMVYSIERGKDPLAARVCARLLEDIIAKTGGEPSLGIVAAPGVHPMDVAASAWRDLGVCYEILAQVDPSYAARVGPAVRRFAQMAKSDDPDLAAARKYFEMHPAQGEPSPKATPQATTWTAASGPPNRASSTSTGNREEHRNGGP